VFSASKVLLLAVSLLYLAPGTIGLSFSARQPTFSNVTIFTPPHSYTDPRILYARSAQLANGDLLATWGTIVLSRRSFTFQYTAAKMAIARRKS
jgi:hypothetical protein